MRVTLLVVALIARMASPVVAQTVAADTFGDAGARALVLHALVLRDSAASGLSSYEATATERMHVGMAVTRRLPLRKRTIYHREQVARVYWDRSGQHTVRWLGLREGQPLMGDGWSRDAPFGLDFDLARELDLQDIGIDLPFDPLGDRMDVFQVDFVQPISATGLRLYRFASGDTMQIRLPSPDRTITLVEVVVRPRRRAWETVEGSLWFDRETGVLARAAFRPSGVWDWEVEEPGDLDDVPGFLKPAIGTIRSIVVEYGLYEQRWWLPRRIEGIGDYDWGHGLVRMPITVEWTMTDHIVNAAPSPEVTPGAGLVGAGTRRFSGDGRRQRTTYVAAPGVDLSRSEILPAPLDDTPMLAFTEAELAPLLARIEGVAGPSPVGPQPRPAGALLASVRYDRVRGPSAGFSREFPVGDVRIAPQVRVATAIPDIEADVAATRGAWSLSAYRRLADASDWNVADGIGNSAATLLFGHDGGDYYRVLGGSLGWREADGAVRASVEAFAEGQRPIARQTDISLATLGDDTMRSNLSATPVDVAGMRGLIAGQHGSDVRAGVVAWQVAGEAAAGTKHDAEGQDIRYGRLRASLLLAAPLGARTDAALELGSGAASVRTPDQREFLLGGAATVRGVRENALAGRVFWLARAEAARGLPGMRIIVFADAGWAGEPDAFGAQRPAVSAGAGASFMDGLFRVDAARGLARAAVWRVYFRLDAAL